jgi:hypothetical protein
MAAKYILSVLAALFIALALLRAARGGGLAHPQTTTWLTVGVIFGLASVWLFARR